jgi:hypothetical protein
MLKTLIMLKTLNVNHASNPHVAIAHLGIDPQL